MRFSPQPSSASLHTGEKHGGVELKPSARMDTGKNAVGLSGQPLPVRRFIITTAGHVDHGKTALVKALTGTDPDRLPEEKARGITIDLGFAHLLLPAGPSAPAWLEIGIIDVPGHGDFIDNMIAGVGASDLALLVVAADDGWMPQTEEHLQILTYLGVPRAVVALSKSDLAGSQTQVIAQSVQGHLENSAFAGAPIIATSVATGEGLQELKETIAGVLHAASPRTDSGKPRLAVDRVFSLSGIGTVVTGTLLGGTFTQGQDVLIQPGDIATRIRSIQSHGQNCHRATPGMRTGLNLVDVHPGTRDRLDGKSVRRGQVVTTPDLGSACWVCDVLLERSARRLHGSAAWARGLENGAHVRVHFGTSIVAGRVVFASAGHLEHGGTVLAQLRLDAPVFSLIGDRFVVRDLGGQATLAGGVVLEPDGQRRGFKRPARQQALRAQAQDLHCPAAAALARIERDQVVRRPDLLVKSAFRAEESAAAVEQLCANGRIKLVGDLALLQSHWTQLWQEILELVGKFHSEQPQEPGLPLAQLRATFRSRLTYPELLDLMLAECAAQGLVQAGAMIKRADHRPALPNHLQPARDRIRSALAARPFDPPSRNQLALDASGRQALLFLLRTGEAIELGQDLVLLTEALECARRTVAGFLASHHSASVSELRQALGSSRRVLIPLLERLDREGLTRREGDRRVLGTPALQPRGGAGGTGAGLPM